MRATRVIGVIRGQIDPSRPQKLETRKRRHHAHTRRGSGRAFKSE
jgi:hypothetical protein